MSFPPINPSPIFLTPTERALRLSLRPSKFRDVHLYAFSRRKVYPDGYFDIDNPLPVVCVGSVLEGIEHFSNLLSSGFSESTSAQTGSQVIRPRAENHEYDYEDDSDLEDYEDDTPPSSVSGPSQSSEKGKSKVPADVEMSMAVVSSEASHAAESESGGVRRIMIPNIAYRTLEACVFYIYTKKIKFLPLKSEDAAMRSALLLSSPDTEPPPCSAKSMYRLAEAYSITELQDLSRKQIIAQLNPQNIVGEVFSSFFSRYDDLRELAISFLVQNKHLDEVQSALPRVIERITTGELPHATAALQALLCTRLAAPKPVLPEPPRQSELERAVTSTGFSPEVWGSPRGPQYRVWGWGADSDLPSPTLSARTGSNRPLAGNNRIRPITTLIRPHGRGDSRSNRVPNPGPNRTGPLVWGGTPPASFGENIRDDD